MVEFTPSEVSFYEHDAQTFLVLDKVDPDRKVSDSIEIWRVHIDAYLLISLLIVIHNQLVHLESFRSLFTALLHLRFRSIVHAAADQCEIIRLVIGRWDPRPPVCRA